MPDLQLGRRMDFPAKATIFEEGEPKVAVYTLRRGIAVRPQARRRLMMASL